MFVSSLPCLFPRLLFVVGKDSLEGICTELFFIEVPQLEKSVQWERLLKGPMDTLAYILLFLNPSKHHRI